MINVDPTPDSKLAALCEQYYILKPEADRLAAELKVVTDALKVELTTQAPGDAVIVVATGDPVRKPLRLTAQTSWRLDSKRLKAEAPETYVRYATRSTSWVLRQGS